MAQKGLMRILSRKDGKSAVLKDEVSEKTKITKVLEFVPARKPEQAKIGGVVRFMYNPGDGHSAYWLEGTLEKRLDKYSVARDSKFTKNRFRAHKLTRARRTIGAKDKREVTSQKILKISLENIVGKLNK